MIYYLISDVQSSKLASDFKTLVSFLVNCKAPAEYLRYPVDVLMALYAYTNDVRYLARKNNILQKLSKGGKVIMLELLDKIEYERAVKIAKNNKRGLWSQANPIAPWIWRIYPKYKPLVLKPHREYHFQHTTKYPC